MRDIFTIFEQIFIIFKFLLLKKFNIKIQVSTHYFSPSIFFLLCRARVICVETTGGTSGALGANSNEMEIPSTISSYICDHSHINYV